MAMRGPVVLLIVAVTLQRSQARRSRQITDRTPLQSNPRADGAGGAESSGKAMSKLASAIVRGRELSPMSCLFPSSSKNHVGARRRRSCEFPSGRRRRSSSSESRSSSETRAAGSSESGRSSETFPDHSSESGTESSSDSEPDDDIVVIIEDHSNNMPPQLPESDPNLAHRQPLRDAPKRLHVACHNYSNQQETSIDPELTEVVGLDNPENVDQETWRPRQINNPEKRLLLEAQASQKRTAIANICNLKIYWRPVSSRSSSGEFTRGVAKAAENVISKSLVFRRRSWAGKRIKIDHNLVHLRNIIRDWNEDHGHVVAKALLDACNAMFRDDMGIASLKKVMRHYDEIIAILTSNVD